MVLAVEDHVQAGLFEFFGLNGVGAFGEDLDLFELGFLAVFSVPDGLSDLGCGDKGENLKSISSEGLTVKLRINKSAFGY